MRNLNALEVRKARLQSVFLFLNLCACTWLLVTALPIASVSSQAFPSHPSLNPVPKVLFRVFKAEAGLISPNHSDPWQNSSPAVSVIQQAPGLSPSPLSQGPVPACAHMEQDDGPQVSLGIPMS